MCHAKDVLGHTRYEVHNRKRKNPVDFHINDVQAILTFTDRMVKWQYLYYWRWSEPALHWQGSNSSAIVSNGDMDYSSRNTAVHIVMKLCSYSKQ